MANSKSNNKDVNFEAVSPAISSCTTKDIVSSMTSELKDDKDIDTSLDKSNTTSDVSQLADAEDETSDSDNSEDDGDDEDDDDEKVADDHSNNKSNVAGTNEKVTDTVAEGDFVEPEEEIAKKISSQVDLLFSDESLRKESYIIKHIRRNKHGFVNLKVLNSLRKIKRHTRDYRVIAYSIKKYSQLLELNEAETKVRRRDALTNPVAPSSKRIPEAAQYRTVVVINLPSDPQPTISSVAELFSKCGSVTQIRIVQSLSSVNEEDRKLLSKHAINGKIHCALVEFEYLSDAKKSCRTMTDLEDWRHGLRVSLLAVKSKKDQRASDGKTDEEGGDKRPPRRSKKNSRVSELSRSEAGSVYSSSGSDTEGRLSGGGWKGGRSDGSVGADSGRRRQISTTTSPLAANLRVRNDSEQDDWRARSGSFDSRIIDGGNDRLQSPWALRRLKAQQVVAGGSAENLMTAGKASGERGSMPCLFDASRVIRQPKGPDGSAGFKRSVAK